MQLDLLDISRPAVPRFYLGTHMPSWLGKASVPLFVSRRTLEPMKKLPRASGRWALDSGGFTELQMHGEWRLTPAEYVALVRRFSDEIGTPDFAAPQDMMCEPLVLKGGVVKARVRGGEIRFAGTGLSVEEHQRRTIDNLIELRMRAPEIPWAPVLQGWRVTDYWSHVDDYAARGINLADEKVVGVGSVCRRQGTSAAALIFSTLAAGGLRLHGFGVKVDGLKRFGHLIASADSLAWSDFWKRRPPLPGHDKPGAGRRFGHKNCANCREAAEISYAELIAVVGGHIERRSRTVIRTS